VTTAEYENLQAINWSSLKHLAVSPLLYKWRKDHPEPSKPAYVVGSACHCAILEPEKFDERYAVYEKIRRGKEWEAWQAEHPGVQTFKEHELADVKAMAKAVHAHRVASSVLKGGRCEEIVTWTDEITGLACKGRLDYLRPDFLTDLKAARDVRQNNFERDAYNYLYAGQFAFYHDGATAARHIPGDERPRVIALQNGEPYDVAVFRVKPETLEWGRALYRRLMQRLVECIESDFWPGVAPDLRDLGMPPWVADQEFAQAEEDF
jgi:hypothetical protein